VPTLRAPRIFDDHEESEAIERLGNDSTSVGLRINGLYPESNSCIHMYVCMCIGYRARQEYSNEHTVGSHREARKRFDVGVVWYTSC